MEQPPPPSPTTTTNTAIEPALVKQMTMKSKKQKKMKQSIETENIDQPDGGETVYTIQSKRSRTLHSYLSIPLTCCLGANSKGTITCSIDFSNNTVDNVTDTQQQDKSDKNEESPKTQKPKPKKKSKSIKSTSDGTATTSHQQQQH